MKAGIDIGTTLTKGVWKKDGSYVYRSTSDLSVEELIFEMKSVGVDSLQIAGIGSKDNFQDFKIHELPGDPIENELSLQINGVQRLLQKPLHSYLLVSIGTGTSYVKVENDSYKKFPLGNSISGGTLKGLSEIMGSDSYEQFASFASNGTPLDILVKDMIPSKANSFEGGLVVSNGGKGHKNAKIEDTYATLTNMVTISTIRDLMLIDMIGEFSGFSNVVYIGSSIAHNKMLRESLLTYTSLIGKHAHVPNHTEYALAMGAYHMNDNSPITSEKVKTNIPKGSKLAKLKGLYRLVTKK